MMALAEGSQPLPGFPRIFLNDMIWTFFLVGGPSLPTQIDAEAISMVSNQLASWPVRSVSCYVRP